MFKIINCTKRNLIIAYYYYYYYLLLEYTTGARLGLAGDVPPLGPVFELTAVTLT